jgi:hypothetical protein
VNEKRTLLSRMFRLQKKLHVPRCKENPQVLLMAEPSPPEPVKRAASNAGLDLRSPGNGTQQQPAQQKHAPSQEPQLEHAVEPSSKPFFE